MSRIALSGAGSMAVMQIIDLTSPLLRALRPLSGVMFADLSFHSFLLWSRSSNVWHYTQGRLPRMKVRGTIRAHRDYRLGGIRMNPNPGGGV